MSPGQATHLEIRFRGADTELRSEGPAPGSRTLPPDLGGLSGVTTVTALVGSVPFGIAAATLVTRLLDALPAVQALTVLSSRALTPPEVSTLVDLHQICRQRTLRCSRDFALDADADAAAALGRNPTSLSPILEESRALLIRGVQVRWWVPIVSALAYRLEGLFSLAEEERIDAVLAPAWIMRSLIELPPRALDADAERFVGDFIAHRLLTGERQLHSAARIAFYEALKDSLGDASSANRATESVAVLDAHERGTMDRWMFHHENRPSFSMLRNLDRSDATSPVRDARSGQAGAELSEAAGVVAEGGRAVLQWAITTGVLALRPRRRPTAETQAPSVVIIGAYGGEHIGDAAILGGVLLRMHRRYGTRHAVLMSQRPDHTRHLVAMLDTPVDVRVEDYQQSRMGALLTHVDAVVFAGGPLMDLPKQLVKHLYTVSVACRDDKPFIIEGIGVGPFLRRASAWTARRLVLMANRITVRTSADGRASLLSGVQAEVGRDPAFDYLETRSANLSRLPGVDRQWIERLLNDTGGRVTVGLNLRPVRPDYTCGVAAGRRVEHTQLVETRFEERLAEAMRQFHTASKSPCFIFFPMNAIQFGSSDLRSAYRIKRLVRGDVDFRIWEGDASIDGVVGLLRRLDVVIAMRFHAAVYALAQQRKVIGIDYRPGKSDKVAALLSDCGQSDSCRRIDEMTADWLVQRLSDLLRPSEA